MADYTATTNYSFKMPTDHVNTNTWGGYNNSNWAAVDGLINNLNAGLFSYNQVVLNKTTVAAGNPIYGKYNGNSRWVIELGDPSAESGSNSGSHFAVYRYDDTGNVIDTSFAINRATGTASFSSSLIVGGAVTLGNDLAAAGNLFGGTATYPAHSLASDFYLTQASGYRIYNWAANWADRWNTTTGLRDWTAPGGTLMSLDVNGILTIASATAYKPGGGSWTVPSDLRIKTVTGDYTSGLDAVLRLRPITYVYKGNEARTSQTGGAEFVGLVADEAMLALPEMVTISDSVIDGVPVNDLKSLDTTSLIFALVNCVKELKAEIEELKAARA